MTEEVSEEPSYKEATFWLLGQAETSVFSGNASRVSHGTW